MGMVCTKFCVYQNSLHFSELTGAHVDLNECLFFKYCLWNDACMKGLVIPGVYLRFQLSLLVLFTLPTELNCIAFEIN